MIVSNFQKIGTILTLQQFLNCGIWMEVTGKIAIMFSSDFHVYVFIDVITQVPL